MDKASAHSTPALGVLATNDDDICWHAEIAQGAMKSNRLLGLVVHLRLDDKKVDIAAGTSLSASMGSKQDDLRAWSSRSQATTRLGYQGLIDHLHEQIVVVPQPNSLTHHQT
jgi:hypothetical protein